MHWFTTQVGITSLHTPVGLDLSLVERQFKLLAPEIVKPASQANEILWFAVAVTASFCPFVVPFAGGVCRVQVTGLQPTAGAETPSDEVIPVHFPVSKHTVVF
jgi:hypothetical protein